MTHNTSHSTETASTKDRVQAFGRFLSAMVMPNIGAFIAWGLITALFIKTGWLPVPELGGFADATGKEHPGIVGPMIKYLLPLLIGYTGGKAVADHRGGVLGAIATMGVIVGADIPMFIGAMIMGPLGGWVIRQFDRAVQSSIPAGFEMLVNNFSAGIIGTGLSLLGFYAIGPVVSGFTGLISSGVQGLVNAHLLPLVSLFIEPGKILFLNNAINHGILTPLGTQQSQEAGKSIYFLLEANPGPGLGVLLAYWMFAKGNIRASAPGAAIIHFLGGIHEIYFPYVLMRPVLLVAVIAGGMTGIATLSMLGGGLVSAASPGSIFAIMTMSPKGTMMPNLLAIASAAAVSFGVSAVLLRGAQFDDDALQNAQKASKDNKGGSTSLPASVLTASSDLSALSGARKVIFACDAGMGSSAMGATAFRKKAQAAGLDLQVSNTSIENIPADADVVVTQQNLTSRAVSVRPSALHVSIDNFVGNPIYDRMIGVFGDSAPVTAAPVSVPVSVPVAASQVMTSQPENTILKRENVIIGLPSETRNAAIERAGRLLLVGGYVGADYLPAMLEREEVASTYIGNGVAIPHGVGAAKSAITRSGIVVLQYPQGVDFDGETAYLVIGIAGAGDEHLQILSRLADALEDENTVKELAKVNDREVLYNALT